MGDKPVIPQLKPFIKPSNNTIGTRSITKNHTLNSKTSTNLPRPTSNSPKTIQNKNNQSTSSNASPPTQTIENHTYKSFTETTANFFSKKDQAIIFNTIDRIPQIEYIKALSILTNLSNIKLASRISNNRFCVYFSSKNIADDIINQYPSINVNNHNIAIRKLVNPSKRIIISNVSPIIPHSHITEALNKLDINTISPISFLKAGFTNDDLSHIISFKRQTHIKNEDINKLPGSLLIHYDDTSEFF
jgi:hypothetical protein